MSISLLNKEKFTVTQTAIFKSKKNHTKKEFFSKFFKLHSLADGVFTSKFFIF